MNAHEIRQRYARGESCHDLALATGLSHAQVCELVGIVDLDYLAAVEAAQDEARP